MTNEAQGLASTEEARQGRLPGIDRPSPKKEASDIPDTMRLPEKMQQLRSYSDSTTRVANTLDRLPEGYGLVPQRLRLCKLTDERLMMRVGVLAIELGARLLDEPLPTEAEAMAALYAHADDSESMALCWCALDATRCLDPYESVLWIVLAAYEACEECGSSIYQDITNRLLEPIP